MTIMDKLKSMEREFKGVVNEIEEVTQRNNESLKRKAAELFQFAQNEISKRALVEKGIFTKEFYQLTKEKQEEVSIKIEKGIQGKTDKLDLS